MKLTRKIAALLCLSLLVGSVPVCAEDTSAQTEQTVAEETATNAELPLGENEMRIYVSPQGSDANDGSFENPVKTIEKGISLASSLKNQNSGKTVSVNIREGSYYLTNPIKLTGTHSGTEENPFIIQAYNGEEVNISGGYALTPSKFSQLKDDAVLARIPADVRKYIGVYSLSSIKSQLGSYVPAAQVTGNAVLYVDGARQTVAQWPNVGFDIISSTDTKTTLVGTEAKNRISNWKNASGATIAGYLKAEYAWDETLIKSINGNEIVIEGPTTYGMAVKKRFKVINILEELDSPGEYYIDYASGNLYYYPPYAIGNSEIEISLANNIFECNGISNITFKGLTIKNTRGTAIYIEGAKNITVDDCEFSGIGIDAIYMNEATDCKIINNTMKEIGMNCVDITGGNSTTLTPSNNLIDNNYMHDWALTGKTNTPAVALRGVGTTITHNLMHSSSAQAILFYGQEHKIMYNEFYDVVNEPTDAGAIYSGRDYTFRGNEIAYNYFHDIYTSAGKGGSIFVSAIYMDDMMSSCNSHHNVIANCELGVMYGGGRDNQFDNNIIVDCDTSMFMDSRGVGWASYHVEAGGQAYNTIGTVPYNKSPWIDKYPELAAMKESGVKMGLPDNVSIQNNFIFACKTKNVAAEVKTYGNVTNNLEDVTDTSVFKDYENRNFGINENSSVAKSHPELLKIDMSEMGLRAEKAAEIIKEAEETKFKLMYPFNGQTEISNIGERFQWQKLDVASKYIVKFAEDPLMENVVMTYETSDTLADIDFIPSGGKYLWWTVTGVSETQSFNKSFEQLGVPKMIVTAAAEKTSKKELKENITLLTTLYNNVQEGTTAGTYKEGFKTMVKDILDDANEADVSKTVLQKDIVAINERTDALLENILQYMNYDVVNVGDLLADQSLWKNGSGTDTFTFNDDGSLTLSKGEEKQPYYNLMMCDTDLGENTVIRFGYKYGANPGYCVIGLQNDASWLKKGYGIIVKSNALEVQRYVGNEGNKILGSYLNYYISDDKWVDLELGALRTGIGTYVYIKADDQIIASELDRDQPYFTGETKFVFGNPSGNDLTQVTTIRAAQE